MTEPTDADAELMKAAVKRSHDQYKLDTSRAAFQAGAIFGSAFRTPQPTQAQAGAVPLTDEQSHALLHRMADECDKWADGLSYEPTREQASGWCVAFLMRELPAHGIKGGQHG